MFHFLLALVVVVLIITTVHTDVLDTLAQFLPIADIPFGKSPDVGNSPGVPLPPPDTFITN